MIDPPYVNNSISSLFLWWCIPAFVFLTYSLVLIKFYTDKKYKNHIKTVLGKNIRMQRFYYLLSPAVIYGFFYILFVPGLVFSSQQFSEQPWREEYVLSEVQGCGFGYGYDCVVLHVKSLDDEFEDLFRWYSNTQDLTEAEGKVIRLSGVEFYAKIIEKIEW